MLIFPRVHYYLSSHWYSKKFLNSEKKERREAQLAKKAETIKAFASEIVLQSPTHMTIDGRHYVLEKDYRNGFEVEKLKERFSSILTKYDYIVGDWGYDQLRLRGFYASKSSKGTPAQSIDRLQDYLYEYCNFGCAYFVLKNLEVRTSPATKKKKSKQTRHKQSNNRREIQPKPYTSQRVYDINKKQRRGKVETNRRRHRFTIRQNKK